MSMRERRNFEGWTALITGASAGFGRELAWQLAPEVGTLILVARRMERLQDLKDEILLKYPKLRVELAVVDLSVPHQMVQLMNWVTEQKLHVDLLVNNAGLGDYGLFEQTDWHKLDQMMMVNMVSLTALTRYVLPEMVYRGRGAVMNISSIASYLYIPTFAVYAATKAYVTQLSEALNAEMEGTGVTVTAICPGPSPTEFGSVAVREHRDRAIETPRFLNVDPKQVVEESIEAVRWGKPCFIPGWRVRLAINLFRLIPREVLRLIHSLTVPEKARASRRRESTNKSLH